MFLIALFFCIGLAFNVTISKVCEGDEELLQTQWLSFKNEYNKSYESETEYYRYLIFKDNLRYINDHNEQYKKGLFTFDMGINKFTDKLNVEYFNEIVRNNKFIQFSDYNNFKNNNENETLFISDLNYLPDQIDWIKKGGVTAVQDQGSCGCCYAFAAVGALETAHFIKHQKLLRLSVQQIIDCSQDQGNLGCKGGWVDKTYKYIKLNKGIDSEFSYPYAGTKRPCQFKKKTIAAKTSGYISVEKYNEYSLKFAVATYGTVAIAVDVLHASFKNYKSGVYYNINCNSYKLSHAMLVVGYGVIKSNGTKEYWKVKNSWGTDWGEEGYIKMSRNKNNNCGIATKAFYPIAV